MSRWDKMIRNLDTPDAQERLETLYGKDPGTVAFQRER